MTESVWQCDGIRVGRASGSACDRIWVVCDRIPVVTGPPVTVLQWSAKVCVNRAPGARLASRGFPAASVVGCLMRACGALAGLLVGWVDAYPACKSPATCHLSAGWLRAGCSAGAPGFITGARGRAPEPRGPQANAWIEIVRNPFETGTWPRALAANIAITAKIIALA